MESSDLTSLFIRIHQVKIKIVSNPYDKTKNIKLINFTITTNINKLVIIINNNDNENKKKHCLFK